MEERDLALRRQTYRLFIDFGRAPTVEEAAEAASLPAHDVADGWRRLHDAHALVLQPDRAEIRMANPFSAIPTRYRVRAGGRDWYANCAWDAFGICAALHADGHIDSNCIDCGAPIKIDVRAQRPEQQDLFFHCLVPARHWWEDIVFT
ncbi:MAG TPA: organomercurial lyase [Candidatus Dormibacteraeota bacterium]|nr:organomercurial lyase [Candidatus Dormibacteraeota bacterium]